MAWQLMGHPGTRLRTARNAALRVRLRLKDSRRTYCDLVSFTDLDASTPPYRNAVEPPDGAASRQQAVSA